MPGRLTSSEGSPLRPHSIVPGVGSLVRGRPPPHLVQPLQVRVPRSRKLTAGRQAPLVIANLHEGETYADLACGFTIGCGCPKSRAPLLTCCFAPEGAAAWSAGASPDSTATPPPPPLTLQVSAQAAWTLIIGGMLYGRFIGPKNVQNDGVDTAVLP
jgi:hypothetical protein